MKKLILILAGVILFGGMSFASPLVKKQAPAAQTKPATKPVTKPTNKPVNHQHGHDHKVPVKPAK